MNFKVCVFVLLAYVAEVLSREYDYCKNNRAYNTLANLLHRDECLNADNVFKHLVVLSEYSVSCRTHILRLLSDHFGHHASTPNHCQCNGVNRLLEYQTGSRDGVTDLRHTCLNHQHSSYRDLYHQFFESTSRDHQTMACRTHHSVWWPLRNISSTGISSGNSCQKDIIYHLKYTFEHYKDHCTCQENTHTENTHTTNGHQGHQGHEQDKCRDYNSYNKLLQLGETDGCLSANSVWHYLDDIQVKDSECRKKIQKHLADKYQNRTSQHDDNCVCHNRRHLVDHQIHRMNNGSFFECRDTADGHYKIIEADLFSNIRADGCKNHNYLWSRLDNVHHYSSHSTRLIDCQRDLIVRAAIQYPTDDSDSCVCSSFSTSTVPTTQSSKTETTTPVVTTSTTTPSTTPTTMPSTTPTTMPSTTHTTMPSTTSTTMPPASATSVKVTQPSTTVTSIKPTAPLIKFACNKLGVVEDLARSLKATHPNSSYCSPNAGGSDDAFVLSTCNMPSPMTWVKGANVMADCESSTQLIPTYTPISTFNGDKYVPLGAQSGVFLGCTSGGIKMAIQKCNGLPEIVNIENGAFVNNPRNYFVIV